MNYNKNDILQYAKVSLPLNQNTRIYRDLLDFHILGKINDLRNFTVSNPFYKPLCVTQDRTTKNTTIRQFSSI